MDDELKQAHAAGQRREAHLQKIIERMRRMEEHFFTQLSQIPHQHVIDDSPCSYEQSSGPRCVNSTHVVVKDLVCEICNVKTNWPYVRCPKHLQKSSPWTD
jgi:Tfp pilus assembly protein PilO